MRSSTTLFAFIVLVVCKVVAEPTLSPYVLHEKRSSVPSGWQSVSSYPKDAVLPLRFAIAQPNIDQLDALLDDVSSPGSPNYGAHWTPAQVAKKFAPSRESVSTVFEWLTTSGFHPERIRVAPTRAWIELNATVTEAERLLHTQYRIFAHDNSGTEHIACDAYHVPKHVTPHLDFITPTIHFNAVLPRKLDVRSGSGTARNVGQPGVGIYPKTTGQIHDLFTDLKDCDKQITPICLRALYGLVYEPLATSENSYGIVEYTPQAYVQSDLDMFAKNFSSGLVGKSPELVSIDGGVVQNTIRSFDVNGESNLDLQYAMALVTPRQPVTLYQVGDTVQGASFNNLLDALDGSYCTFEGGDDPTQDGIYPDPLPGGYNGPASCGITKPAHVISTSYGYNEADLSPAYTARQCAEYAKLGLMGVTVLYSSGDNGVAGNDGLCLDINGLQTSNGNIFNPSFPSTCPYVTSVGATQVNPGSKVSDPEGACEQAIFSGGGFSNYFKRPPWQDKSISDYMAKYGSKLGYPAGTFNATGTRGFPDLSANGANYVVAIDGRFSLVFGTSASSPVVGAILAMVNDARLFKGKQPIGFINPTIYSDEFAGAFNDITSGSNQGCGVSGFNAVEGWDPVTGLGTPSFPKLLARWLLLP